MGNKSKYQKPEQYQEQIFDIFKETVSEEFYNIWADTFEIAEISKKKVIVTYHGLWDKKEFKKECKDVLASCVYSVFGKKKKIEIEKKKKSEIVKPKAKNSLRALRFFVIGMIFVCIAAAMIVVLTSYIGNRNFRETFYNVSCLKADRSIRIVQLSDMHSCSYGENNQVLLDRVEALKPDIILCTGDIVDSAKTDADYAVALGQGLSKIAPSYYIYGNNEVESIYDFALNEKSLDKKLGFTKETRDETALLRVPDSFEEKLEAVGIKVLKNEKDTIQIDTMTLDIYGVLTSNPSAFWSYTDKSFADYIYSNPDRIKITAVHEPFIFEEFQPEFWGDLMVCGHTHGGVVRVPVFGPLYTQEGGLFPERNGSFVYGRYNTAGKPLVVSAGMENKSVYRINNQPELVVIDMNKF